MRALTINHAGKPIMVTVVGALPGRAGALGMMRCQLDNGNFIARHASRLEMLSAP